MTRWWEYSVKTEGHGARPCCPALHCHLQGRNCGSEVIHFSLLLFTSRGMNQHIRGKSGFSRPWLPLSTSYSGCLLAPQQPGHSHCTCIVQAASLANVDWPLDQQSEREGPLHPTFCHGLGQPWSLPPLDSGYACFWHPGVFGYVFPFIGDWWVSIRQPLRSKEHNLISPFHLKQIISAPSHLKINP